MSEASLYERPERLDEALARLASTPVRIAAGCTDLFAATEAKTLPGPVLDLTAVSGLRGFSWAEDGSLAIGATTTWADIVRADLPPALHALQQAARQVGARQVQNRGTLAGNLCNASPAADGVPPLLVVDAEVALASATGERRLALSAFITGPRQTALAPGEIVTGVHIPASALSGVSHFEKLGARAYLVISIAMLALRVEAQDGRIVHAACAVGACGPVAQRLPDLEAALMGAPLSALGEIAADLIAPALAPIDDIRADAGYRRSSAVELVRRAGAAVREAAT